VPGSKPDFHTLDQPITWLDSLAQRHSKPVM
jgi:hypothetical protein